MDRRHDKLTGKFKGQEIWCVADGATCPKVSPNAIIVATNNAWKNVSGKPDFLVYLDHYFKNNYTPSAGLILSPIGRGGEIEFRYASYPTRSFADGIYCGGGQDSAGVAAVSIAVALGAGKIKLFGYDYRVFSTEEMKYYFGRDIGTHASHANHRNGNDSNRDVFNKLLLGKIQKFEPFCKLGIQIVNHSIHSNIPYFERIPA